MLKDDTKDNRTIHAPTRRDYNVLHKNRPEVVIGRTFEYNGKAFEIEQKKFSLNIVRFDRFFMYKGRHFG